MRAVAARFIRFALVGVCGTAAHYGVLTLVVELLAIPVPAATTAGFVVGALVNYALNRRFTFRSSVDHGAALPKFFSIAAVGAVLNAGIVSWLLPRWHVHYLVIQLLATGIVLVWNFAGNQLWTFRHTATRATDRSSG